MESGKALGIAGLIVGLIGMGLGGYVFFDNTLLPMINPNYSPTTITNYYTSDDIINFYNDDETYLNLTTNINLSPYSEVFILFNCEAAFASDEVIRIAISIDRIKVTDELWVYNLPSTGALAVSVSLQHFNTSITGGLHAIDIWIDPESTVILYVASLFIQVKN